MHVYSYVHIHLGSVCVREEKLILSKVYRHTQRLCICVLLYIDGNPWVGEWV